MQRIASLVWATEHLITTLNNPLRLANYNCRTIRTMSNISNELAGQKLSPGPVHSGDFKLSGNPYNCFRYLATDVRHGEEPISWRDQDREKKFVDAFEEHRKKPGFEPFQLEFEKESEQPKEPGDEESRTSTNQDGKQPETSAAQGTPNQSNRSGTPRKRSIPRIVRPRYTKERLQKMIDTLQAWYCGGPPVSDPARVPDPGVFVGVREIYKCKSSCEVAHLMFPQGNSMVNFSHYDCASFHHSASSPTIEFRGAESTLGPWALTWTKICLGLVKFAIWSPPQEFFRVLSKCDIAFEKDGVYDCIDLLDDLGLFAEAEAAEKRIADHKKEWGLEYVEPEKE
ncbi:hypothetical protein F5Y11DRAFT_334618 [Daldinia sp. FL1419]|nr:hypothetical protein F5Y11DRAFT_334618 [Daldinia sp. FL1419]